MQGKRRNSSTIINLIRIGRFLVVGHKGESRKMVHPNILTKKIQLKEKPKKNCISKNLKIYHYN